MKQKKLRGLPSITKLKIKADSVFSKWILRRDENICITCGRWATTNGHYVSRSWLGLRYSELNCSAQCVRCNIFLKGNMDEYALALESRYGKGILEELKRLKVPTPFKRKDYLEIITKYGN